MFKKLNWQPDLPDFRDLPFEAVTPIDALPFNVDLRTTDNFYADRVALDTPVLEMIHYVIKKDIGIENLDPKLRYGFGTNRDYPSIRNETKAVVQKGLKNTFLKYYRINNDIISLKQCLADGYPFVFGFTTYTRFATETAETGNISMPEQTDSAIGSTICLAVGYDDVRKIVILKSYKEAGDNGYFYMPYDYIINSSLSDDFWTVRKL